MSCSFSQQMRVRNKKNSFKILKQISIDLSKGVTNFTETVKTLLGIFLTLMMLDLHDPISKL